VNADHEAILRSAIKGQYHAALAMLRQAIERCPDDLWVSDAFPNRTWRMAYHTLYYTHLYLHPKFEDFRPWAHHQTRIQNMDDDASEPELERYFELPRWSTRWWTHSTSRALRAASRGRRCRKRSTK
jgi:hypothetical protein